VASFDTLRQEVEGLKPVSGISPDEIVSLPEDLHSAFRRMLKGPISLDELASELGLAEDQAGEIGQLLVDRGYLQYEASDPGVTRFRVRFARMRTRSIPDF
jgi:hypothetical protein